MVTLTASMNKADARKDYDSKASAWKAKLEAMKEAAKPSEKNRDRPVSLLEAIAIPWIRGVKFD